MTGLERRAALELVAAEVRACTACRLHEGRTMAVPGEGSPDTEVLFVGEGPGYNEDRLGRPFVGRAGEMLQRLLGSIGWSRDEVFITNVVKCRPPDNRDPQPDEITACAPFLARQMAIIDPALVVTLGRHSLGTFLPGARISQVHGSVREVDPAGASDDRETLVYPLYHPAAALRTPAIEEASFADMRGVPAALVAGRARRAASAVAAESAVPVAASAAGRSSGPDEAPSSSSGSGDIRVPSIGSAAPPAADADQLTLF